jgi:hypothetical protein
MYTSDARFTIDKTTLQTCQLDPPIRSLVLPLPLHPGVPLAVVLLHPMFQVLLLLVLQRISLFLTRFGFGMTSPPMPSTVNAVFSDFERELKTAERHARGSTTDSHF